MSAPYSSASSGHQNQHQQPGPYISPMLKPQQQQYNPQQYHPQQHHQQQQQHDGWGASPSLNPSLPAFTMPGPVEANHQQQQQQQQQNQNNKNNKSASSSGSSSGGGGGTDPTKYKTAICRNWEQTGVCTFRGCTFAHGKDELRPMNNRQGTSPSLGPTTAATKDSPSSISSGGGVPSPSLAPSSGAGARLEQRIHESMLEARRLVETLGVHQEANRTLEMLLRREQQQRAQDRDEIAALKVKIQQLEATVEALKGGYTPPPAAPLAPPQQQQQNGYSSSVRSEEEESEQRRLRTLLSSLQQVT